jgi:hypothetical protein
MNVPKANEITFDTTLLGRRDAFHVPGVLVSALGVIQPGDSVRFVDQEFKIVTKCTREFRQAVVSPFVPEHLQSGTLFWVFLEPDLVASLVHHFDIKQAEPEVKEAHMVQGGGLATKEEVDFFSDDEWNCAECYEPTVFMEEEEDYSCKNCYE